MRRIVAHTVLVILGSLALLLAGPLLAVAIGKVAVDRDWRGSTHRSAGLAPAPDEVREAVVQVYAARTVGWRGAFAVHSWLAAKPEGAAGYTRYEVIGWYARRGGSAVSVSDYRAPDAEWFGAAPMLVRELRGSEAAAVIAALPAAVQSYPWPNTYSAWPGPNSNTFVAHLARELPALKVALPAHAVGKDYLPWSQPFARTPSGTGYQASLGGLFGVAAGVEEGLEVNVLGLVIGLDFVRPSVKVPGFGALPGA